MLKAWFPDGLDTPDIGLLKVSATSAGYWEYWDAPTSPVARAINVVKGQVLGRSDMPGDNETVQLPQA